MPVMNTSELRDARKNRWLHEYGGGIGFESWQIIIGLVVATAIVLVSLVLGQPVVGVFFGVGLGWAAAIAPNYINTHHQQSRDYLEGQVKQRVQKTLVINDKRVSEPSDQRERFFVAIRTFPSPDNGDSHVP